MTESNPEPLTISESAVAMHEILMSLVDAGFTREEALDMLKAQVYGA